MGIHIYMKYICRYNIITFKLPQQFRADPTSHTQAVEVLWSQIVLIKQLFFFLEVLLINRVADQQRAKC